MARPVAIVGACLRDGNGGSPTAVLDEAPMGDDERRRVHVLARTSHAVFVAHHSRTDVSLRFFTAEGELPACGHGTVAALAHLAGGGEYRATVRTAGRAFDGWAVPAGTHVDVAFDPGPVDLREPTTTESDLVLAALGVTPGMFAPGLRVASVGRAQLLVPVATRSALADLDPDVDRLRSACDRLGFLGCYVHTPPTPTGRLAERMFAPSIGVAEDIANANSTACLAAHLAGRGSIDIAVDTGESLGSPSTITATAEDGPAGPLVRVGGAAKITRGVWLP